MTERKIICPENLNTYNHRPAGKPMAREARSQKAQLESCHRHGTAKDVKVPMHRKDGTEGTA